MHGQTMNYSNYYEYLSKMENPIMPSKLPKGKFDFRAIIEKKKKKGVSVPELSEEEKKQFMHYE